MKKIIAIIFFIIAVFGVLRLDHWLIVSDQAQNSGAIVLLGGGTGERMIKALELYQANYAPVLLITDSVYPDPRLKNFFGNSVRQFFMNNGVPGENIFIVEGCLNTYSEAVNTVHFLKSKGISSAIIVSDPFHMRRVKLCFDKADKEKEIRFLYVPADIPWMQKPWYLQTKGVKYVFDETVKWVYYSLRYATNHPIL